MPNTSETVSTDRTKVIPRKLISNLANIQKSPTKKKSIGAEVKHGTSKDLKWDNFAGKGIMGQTLNSNRRFGFKMEKDVQLGIMDDNLECHGMSDGKVVHTDREGDMIQHTNWAEKKCFQITTNT